jgi:hypothetical protein
MSSGNKVKVVGDDNNQDTVGHRRETTTATTKATLSHSQEEAMTRSKKDTDLLNPIRIVFAN